MGTRSKRKRDEVEEEPVDSTRTGRKKEESSEVKDSHSRRHSRQTSPLAARKEPVAKREDPQVKQESATEKEEHADSKKVKNEEDFNADDEDVENLSSDYDFPHLSDAETISVDQDYEKDDCFEELKEPPELKSLSELLSAAALKETDSEVSKAAIDRELQALQTPFCLLLNKESEFESPTDIERVIRAQGIGALKGIEAVRAGLLDNPAVKRFLVRLYKEFNYAEARGCNDWTQLNDGDAEYDEWFDVNGHRVEGCNVRLNFINPDKITNAEAWGTGRGTEYTLLQDDDIDIDLTRSRVREKVWSPFGLAVVPLAKVDNRRQPKQPKTPSDLGSMDAAALLALLHHDANAPPTDHNRKYLLRAVFHAILAHNDPDAITQAVQVIPIDALLPSYLVALSQLPSWPSILAPLVASKTAALSARPDPFEMASLWRLVAGTDGEEVIAQYVAQQPDNCRVVGWRWERHEKDWVAAVVDELLMNPVLTEKMKRTVRGRIKTLVDRVRECRKRFSWMIPGAVFAEDKEIEAFLKSNLRTVIRTVRDGPEEAKRVAKVLNGLKWDSGLDVTATADGREVRVTKTIENEVEGKDIGNIVSKDNFKGGVMGKRSKRKRVKVEATTDEVIGAIKVKNEAQVKSKEPADSVEVKKEEPDQVRKKQRQTSSQPDAQVKIEPVKLEEVKTEEDVKAEDDDAESLSSDFQCPDLFETETQSGDEEYEEEDLDEELEEPPELKTLSELLSATVLEETDREASKAAIDRELQKLQTPFCLLLSKELKGSDGSEGSEGFEGFAESEGSKSSKSLTDFEKLIRAHGIGALRGIDAVRAELLEHPAIKLFLVRLYKEFNYAEARGCGDFTQLNDGDAEYDKWFDVSGHRVEDCKVPLNFINPDDITNAEAWGTGRGREFSFLRDEEVGERVQDKVWSPFGFAVVPLAKVDNGRRPNPANTPSNLSSMDAAALLALLQTPYGPRKDQNRNHRLRTVFRALLALKDADAIRQAVDAIPIDALLPSDLVALSQLPAWPLTLAPLVASKTAALPKRPDPFELASLWRLLAGTDAEEEIARYVARQPDDCRVVGWRWEREEKDWVAAVIDELLMHPVLTERMKATVRSRIRTLATRIRIFKNELSWEIPDAVFPDNKEIEEFLRGDKQTMTMPGGYGEERRIEEAFSDMRGKRGLTVEAFTWGDKVQVKKVVNDMENAGDIVRWRRMQKEMLRLKASLVEGSGTKPKPEEKRRRRKARGSLAPLVASKITALPERPDPFEFANLWRLVGGTDGEKVLWPYFARQPEDCRVLGLRWEMAEKDWVAAVVDELLLHPVITDRMKAAAELRFDALAGRIQKNRKQFWGIPDDVFPESKEIEEFLRGGKKKTTVDVPGGSEEAKRIEEEIKTDHRIGAVAAKTESQSRVKTEEHADAAREKKEAWDKASGNRNHQRRTSPLAHDKKPVSKIWDQTVKTEKKIKDDDADTNLPSEYECPDFTDEGTEYGDTDFEVGGMFSFGGYDSDEERLEQPDELETLSELLSVTELEETDRKASKAAIDRELQNLKTPFCLLLSKDFEGSETPTEFEKRIRAQGFKALPGIDALRTTLLAHPAVKLFLVRLRWELTYHDGRGGSPWELLNDEDVAEYEKWFDVSGHRIEGCNLPVTFINPDEITKSEAWGRESQGSSLISGMQKTPLNVVTKADKGRHPTHFKTKADNDRRPKQSEKPLNLDSMDPAALLGFLQREVGAPPTDEDTKHQLRTVFHALLAHNDPDAIRHGLEAIPVDALLPSDLVAVSQLPSWPSTLASLVASKIAALPKRPDPFQLANLWRLVAGTDGEEALATYVAEQPGDCGADGWRWERHEINWMACLVEELLMHPVFTEKMRAAVQLRFDTLAERILEYQEELWAIPEAVFAENKEIEEFLRGGKQKTKVSLTGGDEEAKRIKDALKGLKGKLERGLYVRFAGKGSEVELYKRRVDGGGYLERGDRGDMLRWRRWAREMKMLKKALHKDAGLKRKLAETSEEEKAVKLLRGLL
ncbi:hypothetical protein HDU96_010614 [Phlyctochytrium bullatum]|nr:hypothetical protein HDU96_010614 [Phlyctochytrium bullatum]